MPEKLNLSQNENIIREDLEFEENAARKHTSINTRRKAKDNDRKLHLIIKSELKNNDADAGTVLRELEKYKESTKNKTHYGGKNQNKASSF